jgi:hypothetical protein
MLSENLKNKIRTYKDNLYFPSKGDSVVIFFHSGIKRNGFYNYDSYFVIDKLCNSKTRLFKVDLRDRTVLVGTRKGISKVLLTEKKLGFNPDKGFIVKKTTSF